MRREINLHKITDEDVKRFTGGQLITGAELKEFLDRVVVGGVAGLSWAETRTVTRAVAGEVERLAARLNRLPGRKGYE